MVGRGLLRFRLKQSCFAQLSIINCPYVSQLSPRLVERHSNGIAQVQAAAIRHHGEA